MNKKKWLLILLIASLAMFVIVPMIEAKNKGVTGLMQTSTYNLATDSNFFGQSENTTPVAFEENPETKLLGLGYTAASETEDLKLFVKERYFQIAILDKNSGYIWYSVYPDYLQLGLSGTSRFFIESGVVIEYYNLDNILVEDQKSYVSGPKYNVEVTYDYETIDQGFKAHLNFKDQAIEFDVLVRLDDGKLVVSMPIDSLVEGDIEKPSLNLDGTTTIKKTSYRLKSVYVFPYFGSNNFQINGYSMIPDGSGALIRYTNVRSATAYTKRLYGTDEGIQTFKPENSTYYLQNELTASFPAFGVNHGYHQAAFLAVMTEGDAYAEVHSYPYGYNSYTINTSFFKFIVRERYTIQTSSNSSDSFQLINTLPYPTDYSVTYYFLQGDQASYSGMAQKYKTILNLDLETKQGSNLNLTVLGLDYKGGLFGKNYVPMTKYSDVIEMVDTLKSEGIEGIDILYTGWNKGGYYDNELMKPIPASILGGRHDFIELMDYLKEEDVQIYFRSNPIISYQSSLGSGVIKKINLANFATTAEKSSLFAYTYYSDPAKIASKVLTYDKRYQNLEIDSIAFSTVGQALFSYRNNQTNYYRNQTQVTITEQLAQLNAYHLGLTQPNSYLWNNIDVYYQSPIESNKYAYITDSIPFIQLVLNGSVRLVSPYVNYVSDYDLFALRLIEYGIEPSFLITKESTHKLRYTNSQHIYTSEFDLWKPVILEMGLEVQSVLHEIGGLEMISHRYIATGLAEVVYENGSIIYVNYTAQTQTISPEITIMPNSIQVVNPS